MLPLPDSSYTKAHPGGLQDRPHSRPVHLAAQPCATVSCGSAGESTDERQCASSPISSDLKHILVGCKTGLTQGRYTWRHNHVLQCLAAVLESRRMSVNALPPPSRPI